MAWLIGIDEAGFGPLLGPLVLGASVWRVPETCTGASVWEALHPVVARPGKHPSWCFVIGDSKQVYVRERGLGALERTVLAMLALQDAFPQSVDHLLRDLGAQPPAEEASLPWYASPNERLPTDAGAVASPESLARLRRVCTDSGVGCRRVIVDLVTERAFNAGVAAAGNKSRFELERVLALLRRAATFTDNERVHVAIDRLGGRNYYGDALARCFPQRDLQILTETSQHSAYRLSSDNEWTIEFRVKADDDNAAVALASMTAKYVRELVMRRFNAFWQGMSPGLRPTAGYYTDARRFLQAIAPLQAVAKLPLAAFVRSR